MAASICTSEQVALRIAQRRTDEANVPSIPRRKAECTCAMRAERVLDDRNEGADKRSLRAELDSALER